MDDVADGEAVGDAAVVEDHQAAVGLDVERATLDHTIGHFDTHVATQGAQLRAVQPRVLLPLLADLLS